MDCVRGTLGFGDEFAAANIGQQGCSDFQDILDGIQHLRTSGLLGVGVKLAIWGGSYGGYMSLRGLSARPDLFACGVPMYGFVHNRWMTFEGGDFTWEEEYIGNPHRWPLDAEAEVSDTFNHLAKITAPTLLMHGEVDDICTVSQSQVAFRVLEGQGTPTQLVVYPGEGHGFTVPKHRRDRDRRILEWFKAHMPV